MSSWDDYIAKVATDCGFDRAWGYYSSGSA